MLHLIVAPFTEMIFEMHKTLILEKNYLENAQNAQFYTTAQKVVTRNYTFFEKNHVRDKIMGGFNIFTQIVHK